MKADRDHEVPLSTAAVKLLKAIDRGEKHGLVFPVMELGNQSPGDNSRLPVASPAYLERRGTTVQPSNLPDHDCRVYCNSGQVFGEWNFANDDTSVAIRMSGKNWRS